MIEEILFSEELKKLLIDEESEDRVLYPTIDFNVILNKSFLHRPSLSRESLNQRLRNSTYKEKADLKSPEERDIASLRAERDELEKIVEDNYTLIHQYELKIEQLRSRVEDQRSRSRICSYNRQSQPQKLGNNASYWKKQYEDMNRKYLGLCNAIANSGSRPI